MARATRPLQAAARKRAGNESVVDPGEAEFHGEFVNFDPVWLYPKPKQKPHPPICSAAKRTTRCRAGRRVLRRLVPASARRLGA